MSKTLSAEAEHKPYFTTKRMALIGVMTAVTCILGPFSIPLPFSPVPISFTNLAIYLAAYVLGMKACTVSYLIYMLLGMLSVEKPHLFRWRVITNLSQWELGLRLR